MIYMMHGHHRVTESEGSIVDGWLDVAAGSFSALNKHFTLSSVEKRLISVSTQTVSHTLSVY